MKTYETLYEGGVLDFFGKDFSVEDLTYAVPGQSSEQKAGIVFCFDKKYPSAKPKRKARLPSNFRIALYFMKVCTGSL